MHELGIVLHVIDQVEAIAKENEVKKVLRITLEVGEVSSIVPSYFTECFEWSKKHTEYLQECELEMIILKGKSYCKACKKIYGTVEHGRQCPYCGSYDTYLITGDEINIKDISVI